MINRPAQLLLRLMLFAALLPGAIQAEQSKTFGDYTIHFSAFPSDLLTPEVAKNYNIKRSKGRALINISVLKKHMGATGQSVKAAVTATATNLNQQLRTVDFKEIQVEYAVYYLGQVRIGHGETLAFDVHITPQGEDAALNFRFEQQFFTE